MKRVWMLVLCLMLTLTCALAEGVTPLSWDAERAPSAPNPDNFLPDQAGYHDSTVDIRIEHITWEEASAIVAYVKLVDPTQLRTALMARFPSKITQPVATVARRVNAVLAVNGDWFITHEDGIVYRNGVKLRFRPNSGRDTLIIDDKGDFTILKPTPSFGWGTKAVTEGEAWWEGFLEETGITPIHTFCFGPGLVVNGEVIEDHSDDKLGTGWRYPNRRMGIGQLDTLSYVIVTCDGPDDGKTEGMTLAAFARLFKHLGCDNAYNLDGGSSACMVMNNQRFLKRGSRDVSDILWIASLE